MKRTILPLLLLILSPAALLAQEGLPDFTYQGGLSSTTGPNPANLDNAPSFGITGRLSSVTLGDLNGDGLLDFMSGSREKKGPAYFQNTGTATAPEWTHTPLPSIDTIVVNADGQLINEQKVTLHDIDNDGDLDMLLHSRFDYNNFKLNDILFYENIGTPTSPEFTFSPSSYPELQNQQVAEFAGSDFVDIDNDMDKDLVIMGSDSMSFFLNTGTVGSPAFERKVAAANPFHNIRIPYYASMLYSTPVFLDLDEDGDYDLYFGNEAGDLAFIENTGTATNPIFGAEPVITTDLSEVGAFSTLAIKDVNDDGILDIVGGQFIPGEYFWYKGSYPLNMISAVKNSNTQITVRFSENVQTNGTNPTDFTVTDGNGSTFTVSAQADGTPGDNEIILTLADISSAVTSLTVTYANNNNEISSVGSGAILATDGTGVAVGASFTTTFIGGSWDNGSPNASYIAIVDQDYTSTADMNFYSLTVNEGKSFTLNGHKATITTDLVLENGASYLDNGTTEIEGTTTIKRAVNAEALTDFHLMSFPISDGNIENSFQGSYAYRYVGAGNYSNIYNFDNSAEARNGEGLAISGNGSAGITRSYNGRLNKDAVNYTMISSDAWNLLGNPYPTQLDLAAFYTENAANMTSSSFYFFNENTGSFDTWNTGIGSGTGAATAYAAVAQGFFVEINSGCWGNSCTVNYTPAMRSLQSNNFLRSASQDNLLRLSFNKTETLLHWGSESDNAFDSNDANYMQGSAPQGFYSKLNDQTLAIQSFNSDFDSKVINLGYYNQSETKGTIAIENFSGTDQTELILIDRYEGLTHDLNAAAYEFAIQTSDEMIEDRFQLVIAKTSLATDELTTPQTQIVVSGNNRLEVFSSENDNIREIQVYTTNGTLVYHNNNINNSTFQWETNIANGLYMIEIKTDNHISHHKVFIP